MGSLSPPRWHDPPCPGEMLHRGRMEQCSAEMMQQRWVVHEQPAAEVEMSEPSAQAHWLDRDALGCEPDQVVLSESCAGRGSGGLLLAPSATQPSQADSPEIARAVAVQFSPRRDAPRRPSAGMPEATVVAEFGVPSMGAVTVAAQAFDDMAASTRKGEDGVVGAIPVAIPLAEACSGICLGESATDGCVEVPKIDLTGCMSRDVGGRSTVMGAGVGEETPRVGLGLACMPDDASARGCVPNVAMATACIPDGCEMNPIAICGSPRDEYSEAPVIPVFTMGSPYDSDEFDEDPGEVTLWP